MCFVKKLDLTLIENKNKAVSPKSRIRANDTKRCTTNSTAVRSLFDKSKIMMSLDYIFGKGVSKKVDFVNIAFVHSRKTGRLKQLEDKNSGKILFTFRPNGTIAPTPLGASLLLSTKLNPRFRSTVTVMDGVSEVVSSGKTVFCKHVVSCDDSLRAGEDVLVLNEAKKLLAVGRMVLSGSAVKQFKRGQAIKVREGAN